MIIICERNPLEKLMGLKTDESSGSDVLKEAAAEIMEALAIIFPNYNEVPVDWKTQI